MFLAGHKQPATTARYLRPQKQAAAEGFHAAATDELRSHGPIRKKKAGEVHRRKSQSILAECEDGDLNPDGC